MTYFASKQEKHRHRFFLDANDPTKPPFCLCGKEEGRKTPKANKYGAKKSAFEGYVYDSGKEANYAAELELLRKAGKIIAWDRQFPVDVAPAGKHLFTTKVDFRLHMPEGNYELHEVKSWITERRPDYRIKRKALELYWLPKHPEYSYHVIQ
jgi:hypothetical protein